MGNSLSYDLMLETNGILRSRDLRLSLDKDLVAGEMINVYGREWLVTGVESAKPNGTIDRRAIAREVPGNPSD